MYNIRIFIKNGIIFLNDTVLNQDIFIAHANSLYYNGYENILIKLLGNIHWEYTLPIISFSDDIYHNKLKSQFDRYVRKYYKCYHRKTLEYYKLKHELEQIDKLKYYEEWL